MSYTIPETVVGLELFVPTDFDQFSIVPGGMPNGDACLRIRGDLGPYKAFQPAPSLTPSILGVTAVSWSITLWIKCPGGTTVGTGQVTNVILGIMNAEMTNGTFNTNMAWALQGYSTNAIAFTKGTTGGGNNVFSVLTPLTGPNIVRDDTWKMVTIHIPQVGITGAIYVNNESVPAYTDVHPTQSASLPGQFLCIGAYSQPMTYLARDYQLGKIAFHDHMLNQTERSLLYESVVP